MSCQLVNTEEKEGFTIRFYTYDEDTTPEDSFDFPKEDMKKLLKDIENGDLVWFCAKVTASKANVELATDYLGGCCYKSVQEFMEEKDGYYSNMVDTVIDEARKTIAKLVA